MVDISTIHDNFILAKQNNFIFHCYYGEDETSSLVLEEKFCVYERATNGNGKIFENLVTHLTTTGSSLIILSFVEFIFHEIRDS